MKVISLMNTAAKVVLSTISLGAYLSVGAVTWPSTPLGATTSATPMTMLVMGKDHKLFYEAYNDASDVDGDGTLDIRYKPSITYYGLYDSSYCYNYSTSDKRFNPGGTTSAAALYKCTGSAEWSGNWLNYVTTSRIDALRKVLYGGFRDVDSTSQTILRRAYIPQDAHSWAKEYTSVAVDGYDISDYTPLALPNTNRRHFFGNLTPSAGVNCSTLSNCSDLDPWLSVVTNSSKRVWEWASKERPVLDGTHGGTRTNYTVRILVCSTGYTNGCKQYPNGGTPIYKPVGLLHDYGETDSMYFGLMTGSYDKHMSGGRLRKVMSSFSNEVNAVTGQFTTNAKLVDTINNLRIRGFNQSSTSNEYWKSNPYADSSKFPTEGQLVDWGNPIGEILYEALRYFAGKKTPTSAFSTGTTFDTAVGLSSATWDDPYEDTSSAKAPFCAKANFLTISDVNTSFDSNQIPGSYFESYSGDLTGLNVQTQAGVITAVESNITGMRFIGQSGTLSDSAPTAKNVTSLSNIRGLAPDEPGKQGSYYSAAVSLFAKTVDWRTDLKGTQTADNYVVALASPLPKIEAKTSSGKLITLVPFAKTVAGNSISRTKGDYQPTNQIVDFYVTTIANSGESDKDTSVNGGRYYAEFQINFEDVEQGGDHDMDAIAKYVVKATESNTLEVTVTPTYQAGGGLHHMGYVISGTDRDGVYLVARDEIPGTADNSRYFLNVPAGRSAGYCDKATIPNECRDLPSIGQTANLFTFSPGTNPAATLLKDPLWYAAKYGGFVDDNKSNTPDLKKEWDSDNDGVPDTYFLVQNPLKLRDSLRKAFNNILDRSGSGGNVIANSTVLSTESLVYQGTYNSENWSGDLVAYPVTTDGVGATPAWRASQKVPLPADRNIFYGSVDPLSTPALTAKQFLWSTLSAAEKTALFGDNSDLLDYVRGVRTKEVLNGGELRNRALNNVLGDIAHSSPFYVKDTEMVFIGANDGMLHAFDATTGVEKYAYIPSAVLPKLKDLTEPNFKNAHQYFVDGDMVVTSTAQTPGKNYLVGTLGRGGKGLFGLDVSSTTFNTAGAWEYFDATDKDLGYMIGRPVLGKMKNGDWVVLVGNGYNSTDQKAVLYVVRVSDGTVLAKLDTGVAGDNGLAAPGLRLNGNGEVEYAYAGDLLGNVWKFDFSSATPSNWKVDYKLFTAKDASNNPQPITAPVKATQNTIAADANYGKWFVHFGTGSDFRTTDPKDLSMQTWYGLIDEGATITDRSELKSREITKSGTLSSKPVRVFEEAVSGDMAGKKGFYIDLVVKGESAEGERIVTSSNYYKLAEPVLLASSVIPMEDVCSPGGRGFINAINPFNGGRLTKPFFDVNGDGKFTSADELGGDAVGSIDLGIGKPGEGILVGDRFVVGGSDAKVDDVKVNLGIAPFKGRISWREIIKN